MNSTWRQAPEFRLAIIAVIVFLLTFRKYILYIIHAKKEEDRCL